MLHKLSLAILLFIITACNVQQQPPSPTPTIEPPPPLPTVTADPTPLPPATTEPTPTTTTQTATATPATQPDPVEPERPQEAILILEPGPGSRVTSPIQVVGEADPTFEQSLVVRLVLADGTEIALEPAQIAADLGQRGPFVVDVPFTVSGEEQAFIQVYSTSARDGGIIHLNAVGVTIADSGPEEIVPVTPPHPERITIFEPVLGATISGGTVHVEGFGLAGFEQTFVIEVQDADGNVIGSEPIIVQAPDLGQPGPFSADVAYTLSTGGPGRIVVRDPSPAFGGDIHVSSVELNLEP